MPRVEEYQEGAWEYKVTHEYEKHHTLPDVKGIQGWWKRLAHSFVCCPSVSTTSYKDDPLSKEVHQYPCGYTKNICRERKEEEK